MDANNPAPPLGIGTKTVPKDTDHANLQGMYGYLGIRQFTHQEELFVLMRLRGLSIRASANAAGMSVTKAQRIMDEPDYDTVMEYLREQVYEDVRISLDTLNSMALEAIRKAGTAAEELKGVETLARLNEVGGYAGAARQKQRVENEALREKDITPKSARQLETMEQGKLIQLAAIDGLEDLAPTPISRSPEGNERGGDKGEIDEDIVEGEIVDDS